MIVLPWIRIQIGPKSWIRIQIQCIWIHNTGKTLKKKTTEVQIAEFYRPQNENIPPERQLHENDCLTLKNLLNDLCRSLSAVTNTLS